MSIATDYNRFFGTNPWTEHDFILIEDESGIMFGIDKQNNPVVVIRSSLPQRNSKMHKTQNMSIECNVHVSYRINDENREDIVHILRCLSQVQQERELFLELASIMIMNGDGSEESLMNTFHALRTFFNDKKEISDGELVGLYAELYTIRSFHDDIALEQYWQSRDKMKFDFSISETIKLEVKATTQNTRTHHFRHEQLMTELYSIYILSYLFRYDDEGLSLYDLILQVKQLLLHFPEKLLIINRVLKNTSKDRLNGFRFNSVYTDNNRHFYRAEDIPKFNELTPSGVANAEYDCILDTIDYLNDDSFIQVVQDAERGRADV